VPAASASADNGGGFFSGLARKVGLSNASADTTASAPPPPPPAKPKAGPRVDLAKQQVKPAEAKETNKEANKETKQAARPAPKPSVAEKQGANQQAATSPPSGNLVSGAQPIVQANSFESRFSAMK
jgi:hypothetical protein